MRVRTQVVMMTGHENKKARAESAGFMKFLPIPPNSCLTMMMAKPSPTSTSHSGAVTGMLKASKTPVTIQDMSPVVLGRRVRIPYSHSKNMQPQTEKTVRTRLRQPKTKTETATETGLPKRASQLYYEKEVDAILNELMAEMKQTEEKIEQIYAQPAPQPKTVQEEGKRPLSSPKTERPSFLNMTTDEIIEQFTMELEEARLRPLDEDQNQSK